MLIFIYVHCTQPYQYLDFFLVQVCDFGSLVCVGRVHQQYRRTHTHTWHTYTPCVRMYACVRICACYFWERKLDCVSHSSMYTIRINVCEFSYTHGEFDNEKMFEYSEPKNKQNVQNLIRSSQLHFQKNLFIQPQMCFQHSFVS